MKCVLLSLSLSPHGAFLPVCSSGYKLKKKNPGSNESSRHRWVKVEVDRFTEKKNVEKMLNVINTFTQLTRVKDQRASLAGAAQRFQKFLETSAAPTFIVDSWQEQCKHSLTQYSILAVNFSRWRSMLFARDSTWRREMWAWFERAARLDNLSVLCVRTLNEAYIDNDRHSISG